MVIIPIGLELTYSGIIRFLEKENFTAANAEYLGVHLNIPRSTMETLKRDYVGNTKAFFYAVIGSWLDLTKATSEKLAEALDKCGYSRISEKIRSKFYLFN